MDTFLLLLAPALAATINAGTPLMLAAFGLLINEKAGVLNLGAEGMMLLAAISGFAVTVATGSTVLGFAAGALGGMAAAGFFALDGAVAGRQPVRYRPGAVDLRRRRVGLRRHPLHRQEPEAASMAIPVLSKIPFIGTGAVQPSSDGLHRASFFAHRLHGC
jgi:hypothetical protein